MSFRAIVQGHEPTLTPSEKRVARVLLGDPQEAATLLAAQVAATVGVHEATVTRLAQKLGYSGYAGLRADLQRDARNLNGSAVRAQARATKAHEVSRLAEDEIGALSKLADHIDQKTIDQAAKALLNARQIYVFGANHATTLVEFMDRRLRRIGLEIVDLRYQGRGLAERVVTLSRKDVVLAFAFKEQPPGLSELLRHANATDCPSILVTDPPGVLMSPIPTHIIAAPRGADDDFHTLVVPLVICYALQLAMTNLEPERFGAALDQVDTLAQIYAADGSGDDFGPYTRS